MFGPTTRALVLLTALALSACKDGKKGAEPTTPGTDANPVDADDDGYTDDVDCDDNDAAINPDADEICDGLDNDCDGDIDVDAIDASTWYSDSDGDGFGDADAVLSACEQPADAVVDNTDCDDSEATVYPGAEEFCDRIDNNCDDTVDYDGWVPGDYADLTTLAAAAVTGHFCLEAQVFSESGVNVTTTLHLQGSGVDETILDGAGVIFDTSVGLELSHLTVQGSTDALISHTGTGDTRLHDIRFDSPNLGPDNGSLVLAYTDDLYVENITVEDATVALTEIWYGLFYGEDGDLFVDGLEVWNGDFSSTSSSYGTLYHNIGTAVVENYHVWDSQFDFSFVYGLLFCEEDGGGDQTHRNQSATNNVVNAEAFYGALSLDDVTDNTVIMENISLVGNAITITQDSYGLLGYLYNNGMTYIHNLVIAGNTIDGALDTESVLLGELGYQVDAQNWTVAHNVVTAASYGPMVTFYGDWTLRNLDFTNNGLGSTFNEGFWTDGTLDVDYVHVSDDSVTNAFVDVGGEVVPDTLLTDDPLYTDDNDADPANWDLTLQGGSPLIDAGDPAILDTDGTVSDIGAYGGPLGGAW